ncbi:MAG: DUF4956 domain-containing protein [Abditibacteriota bacterium]|nr:DUF4956 domain-containing protein [Abditibacteriota bacterium]
MLSFSDIFKKSFLEGYGTISPKTTALALLVSCLFALYIFLLYRVVTRKTFYSKSFNITLAGLTVITTAVILTIQSNIVLSLGLVGALSIGRFRTAIKDPMDLMFLFWSIGTGIVCGAGLAEIAAILAIVLTIGIIVLDAFPTVKAPMLLIVNADNTDAEEKITAVTEKFASHPKVKSRNMTATSFDIIYELRTSQGGDLVKELMALDGVTSASLMSHDGETTF